MTPHHFSRCITDEHGFSLIEVMVALAVTAFGLLGLAGLMLKGLQSNADSQMRSIAISQAYDIADRMRANYQGVKDGKYNAILPSSSSTTCSTSGLGTTAHVQPGTVSDCSNNCTSSACSSTNVANKDACMWQARNAAVFPAGTGAGAVCKDTAAGSTAYNVYISWNESKGTSNNRTFTLRIEP